MIVIVSERKRDMLALSHVVRGVDLLQSADDTLLVPALQQQLAALIELCMN